MREWMKSVERQLALSTGIPRLVADTIQIVREEQVAQDVRHPTAPIELTYQTAYFIDPQGRRRSRLLLDFPDVTKATDGTDITVDRYELWGRDETQTLLARTTSAVPGIAEPGITLPGLAATPWNIALEEEPNPWEQVSTNPGSFFRSEGFIPGSVWRFRVRAIGLGMATPGEWSIEILVQMLEDETPPPQPSPPTAVADRGTITVSWDGQSVLGPMPADFKYAILAHGTDSSPTHEIARFGRVGGFTVVADIPYYDPQFFRLAAVDESGNMGPWSEQAVAYTTPLVDRDIILSTIDAAKTHLINIHAGVSILPNTIITEHLVVTEEMTAAIANFLEVNVDMLDANEIWADELWVGLADAKLVRADMFVGKEFFGGTFTGATFQTSVEEYSGLTWDATGLRAYNAAGTETFSVSAANGLVTTVGRIYTSVAGKPGIAMVPPADSWNGLDMGIWFAGDSHSLPGVITAGIWMADPQENLVHNLNLRGSNYGGVTAWNGLALRGNSTRINSGGGELWIDAGGDVILDAGTGRTVNLRSHGAPYAMTASGAANVYMYSTGQLFKSTSSLRYKDDVQDWDPGMAALNLRPRSWTDKAQIEGAEPGQRYYGYIAEEVERVLPELVVYDEEGRPDALSYDRFQAAMIPILRDIVSRLDAAGL
jgi:hypothetical protein